MAEISKDSLLRSWKEIAAYLGVDIRTCHRWEDQRGMPVHRIEGAEKKSPVFAYKDELDAWFKDTYKASDTAVFKVKKRSPWKKWALGGAGVIVLAGAFLREGRLLKKPQPADFGIEGSFLVIRDKTGRELWRWDTGMEDLKPESFYRAAFQHRTHHDNGNILPAIIIKDIDKDGSNEVLFAPKGANDQTGEGWLYCYDRKGEKRWEYRVDKELRCGGTVYSPDYRIAGFHTHDLVGDGKCEIVVESFHAPNWPCQLALLDASGKKLGEYWNAGYLRDVAYWDLDGDGRDELIVVGVNKEYRSGCLIVFDPRRIGGSSPQTGAFACEGLGLGTELYYVVTPPTEVTEALGPYTADLYLLDVTENKRIRATSSLGLMYEFDFDLKPLQVGPGDGFKILVQRLAAEGKITGVLDDAYLRGILAGIRYWNGKALVAEPSAVEAGAAGR
ncbi:MAG TPA: hypothetical protein VLJ16_11060 [Acidobacteriota bacterium]|nr:hypothetical protein [Acidobacteriota bacterium]